MRRLGLPHLQYLVTALEARLPPKPAPQPRPVPTSLVDEVDDLEAEFEDAFDGPGSDAGGSSTGLDLKALRKCVRQARDKKSGGEPEVVEHRRILDAIFRGTALAVPGNYPGQTDLPRGRSITINRAAWLLAQALPLGTPWDNAEEVLRPAVEATDCEPEGVESWMNVARVGYNKALDRALERAQEKQLNDELAEATRRALGGPPASTSSPASAASTPMASFGELAGAVTASEPPTGPLPLKCNTDGHPVSNGYNIFVCLSLAKETAGFIRWNEVTRDIEVTGGAFANVDSSVLPTDVMNWLQAVHNLDKVKRHEVEDQILLVAKANKYDPIKDYLNGLVWDGVPRLERFFFDYVKARTVNEDGVDITAHLRRIGRKFFIGAAARPLHPGVQLDTMLVLEGPEGKGKTSAFRILFGDYYAGMKLDPGNKDTLLTGSNNWGLEFEELAALTRAADEALKAYITTMEDKFRPPYGRRVERAPRRCVLLGTTNEDHWLTWGKGLRRYWPVYVEAVDLDALRRDRDQLWAEAVARLRGYTDTEGNYHAPEPWHLTDKEWEEARQEAATRVADSYVEQKIQTWYYRFEPGSPRRQFVTIAQVIEECLNITSAVQVQKSLETTICSVLKRMGFKRDKVNGVRGWVPVSSEETA